MVSLQRIACLSVVLASAGAIVLVAPALCFGATQRSAPFDGTVSRPDGAAGGDGAPARAAGDPSPADAAAATLRKHPAALQSLVAEHYQGFLQRLPPTSLFVSNSALKSEPTSHQAPGQPVLVSKRVHLRKGQIPGVLQSARIEVQPGAKIERHSHTSATEIFHGLDGECTIVVGKPGGEAQRHAVAAGGTVAVGPNTEHELENPTRFVCHMHIVLVAPPAVTV